MDAQTALLLRKSAANEQATAARELENVPDVFGFQAQQAIEKLLKALLNEAGLRYPRSHDLAELAALVESHDAPLPQTPLPLARLTPFAVQFRYEELPIALRLDPTAARETVRILREHVERRCNERAR